MRRIAALLLIITAVSILFSSVAFADPPYPEIGTYMIDENR
jgi:hypothetical protein